MSEYTTMLLGFSRCTFSGSLFMVVILNRMTSLRSYFSLSDVILIPLSITTDHDLLSDAKPSVMTVL